MRTVPEPNAELLSAEDVDRDVALWAQASDRRRAEHEAYEILHSPDVREMLKKLIESGECASEGEAITRGLRRLVTAVTS